MSWEGRAVVVAAVETKCPCCGTSIKSRVPLVDLQTNTAAFGNAVIQLSGREAELLTVLIDALPGAATYNDMASKVWHNQISMATIRHYLRTLQSKIPVVGFHLQNVHSVGMRLVRS
jgi:DNA-binding response OmpR family regulator